MSALDLVEEFRALDDASRAVDVESSAIGKLSGDHESLGAADLSGIQALDDEIDEGDFDDSDGGKGVQDSTPTLAAITSLHAPASLFRDGLAAGGRKPPGSDQQLALARDALDSNSEAWDSDDDDNNPGALRSPSKTRTVNGTAGVGGHHGLEIPIGTWEYGAREERLTKPPARGFPSTRGADGTGSAGSYSSNRNILSPTRPEEESSDWDGGAGRSSGGDESENNQRLPQSLRAGFVRHQRSDAATHGAPPAARRRSRGDRSSPNPPSPCLHSPAGASSPVSEPDTAASGAASASSGDAETAMTAGSASVPTPHEHHRRAAPPSQRSSGQSCGSARQATALSTSVSPSTTTPEAEQVKTTLRGHEGRTSGFDGLSGTGRTGDDEGETRGVFSGKAAEIDIAPGEAATISALRSELSTLREHVLRSEREREAQLREFRTRLEAQERRRSPSDDRTLVAATHTSSPHTRGVAKAQPAAFGTDGGVETGSRQDAGSGGVTPQGAAVHNPFAGTGGGAATTPRDHFPAFEDALLDGGEEDEEEGRAARLGRGENGGGATQEDGKGGGGARESVLQDEAFDFSIDTLSHINNHTDFGTHAPVTTAALPTATPAISPKIDGGRDGKGYRGGQPQKARLPWVIAGVTATHAGDPSKTVLREEEDVEEAFDEKDTAAEEAFFSDACATASLQTPVKHLVAAAAAAVSGLGIAGRRGRNDAETPARRKPSTPLFKAEQSADVGLSVGGRLHSRGSLQSERASLDSQAQSPALCMADFFARASAELEGEGFKGDGGDEENRGREGLPVTCGTTVVEESRSIAVFESAGEGRERSVGVDASCQTDWTFSAHDEIRFVSVPACSSPPVPLSVRMADGRGCSRGSEDGAGWKGPGSRVEESPEEAVLSRAGERAPNDGRAAPCFSPRQSQPTLCQTPRRCPKRGCAELRLTGGAGAAASESSSFFNSPNLSPIAIPRTQPEGAVTSGLKDALASPAVGAQIRGTPRRAGDWEGGHSEGGREGSGGGGGGGGTPRVTSARRQQRFEGLGHGLSPILSEREGSASPGGGKGRGAFNPRAPEGAIGGSGEWAAARAGVKTAEAHASPGRSAVSGWTNSPFLSHGSTAAPRGAVVGSSASGPLFMDSSADVTRSSVLRASTTLNTMAPLDDTGTSLCCSSRTGISFAGELFADSRLRVSSGPERGPRYDVFLPRREQQPLRRDAGGSGGNRAQQPRLVQQRSPEERRRRSRSSPGLASDLLPPGARSEANRIAAAMMAREAPPLGPNGVPPGVVGAWLAAAIEGMYSHNASGGGGSSLSDQRVGAKRSQGGGGVFDLDPDARVASHLPYVCQTPPAHGDRQAVAIAEPEDSPPPPPPPPETPLDGKDEEVGDEEDIFYQRQRLLQRVVSAAASHGGVVPSMPSVRDASLEEEEENQEPVSHTGRIAARVESSRRHSDPLTWKTPSVAVAAAAAEAAAASGAVGLAGVSAFVTSGPSTAYMRRHTSGYWRDRLGMTH